MGMEIEQQAPAAAPFKIIVIVAAIAAGVQFGWALQLSLLTPYVQLLGVPHMWSAFVWLCGPISGLTVQPIVGYYSDHCSSRFGRRRPFILAGALLVAIAVVFIGFAADFGHAAGDPFGKGTKPRAIAFFVIGFWILDVANNTLQGPCRALLADLSGGDARKMSTSNALFSFFMAVGNVLGYSAGSYTNLHKIFPFTKTAACDVYCANLKSCFIISIALLLIITALALTFVHETVYDPSSDPSRKETHSVFGELFGALKGLPRPMWILMMVTAVTWIAWFPFLLFDTDWMGKEVYGGKVGEGTMYDRGVRAGSLGLMLNSIVLGLASLGVQYCAKSGLIGVKKIWGGANFMLAFGFIMMVVITKVAEHHRRFGPDGLPLPPIPSVKIFALSLFAFLGIPLAALFSIPFAMASIFSSSNGSGQGLSLGVLNLSIVIPQMIVSVLSGPFDNLFGGGNLPAFIAAAVFAVISGVMALKVLPSPPSDSEMSTARGFH